MSRKPTRSSIRRIGREPNVAEVGVQRVQENPALMDHVATNLMARSLGLTERGAAEAWRSMSDDDRDTWRRDAIRLLRQEAAEYTPPVDPDDPDPGAAGDPPYDEGAERRIA